MHLCTMPAASLVIATYNWPAALELCLLSVQQQSQIPDEVVIADDGSTEDTRALINQFRLRLPMPVKHIWHEDRGFRKSEILNKACVEARHPYLIQVDGDLILHKDFVRDHTQAAKTGHFIGGSRVLLDQQRSQELIQQKSTSVTLWKKGVTNRLNGLHHSGLGRWASAIIKTRNPYNIRGCNMSYWKEDMIRVNGYNQNYTGWGREDTDLIFRFYHAGLRRTFFKFRGITYHLWHREAARTELKRNDTILEHTIKNKIIRAAPGIDQHLNSLA